MKKYLIIIFLIFVVASAECNPVKLPQDYKVALKERIGKESFDQVVYVSGDFYRVETTIESSNINCTNMAAIIDKKLGKAYGLLPKQNRYIETTNTCQAHPSIIDFQWIEQSNIDYHHIGSEKINGINATKYSFSYDGHDYFLWVNDKSLPLAIKSIDGVKELIWGPFDQGVQSADLFKIPAGFQRMQMFE